MIEVKHSQTCYYNVHPRDKTLEQCRSHGSDHRAYQWTKKIDPRWSEEQKQAYLDGYEQK